MIVYDIQHPFWISYSIIIDILFYPTFQQWVWTWQEWCCSSGWWWIPARDPSPVIQRSESAVGRPTGRSILPGEHHHTMRKGDTDSKTSHHPFTPHTYTNELGFYWNVLLYVIFFRLIRAQNIFFHKDNELKELINQDFLILSIEMAFSLDN